MAEKEVLVYGCRFVTEIGSAFAKLQLDAVDTEVNRIRRKVQEQCSKTSLGEKVSTALRYQREAARRFRLCYGP